MPMTFSAKLPPGDPRRVVKLSLIIDENPVPLAAAFTLGERLAYTLFRRASASTPTPTCMSSPSSSDGSLHMATRYVKAAGGCSAPMVKSLEEAHATLGQMKFRLLRRPPRRANEALVMLRHPNNSGLQMDQMTRLYTPARYIEQARGLSGRRTGLLDGRRHLDLGGPELPLQLRAQRRQDIPRRGERHDRQDLFRRVAGRPRRRLKAAGDAASEAAHLRFGLRAPQLGEIVLGDGGAPEDAPDLSRRLATDATVSPAT